MLTYSYPCKFVQAIPWVAGSVAISKQVPDSTRTFHFTNWKELQCI